MQHDCARLVMENIAAVIMAGGSAMEDVFECTVLMADLSEYATFNEVYALFFEAESAPARAAYQVVALPLAARTEVKCTAMGKAKPHPSQEELR